jgi:hypothetical protein
MALLSRLHRARSASRSKAHRATVGGSRKSAGAPDESATGSVNFFGPGYDRAVHLRPPSIDRGVTSAAWAIGLALFLFFGMWSVGVSPGTAFVLSAVAGGAIFLFVRVYGEPDPPRRGV